jgi:hypothetical protein
MGAPKIREDVNSVASNKTGAQGILESLMRRFRTLSFLALVAPLAIVCGLCLGVAVAPAIWIFETTLQSTMGWFGPLRYFALGCALSFGYLSYGLTLIFVVPLANFLMPFRIKAFRGPWFSLQAIPWYIHNALVYLVRYTFLEFITPTPLNILFYRMMGMKIGKGVVINTTNISDPAMITIEDYVTVGGSATIFGHYGQKGYLIISPVRIGKGTNIGLKASVMGGAQVGENVTIKPHSCVLPKTAVGDGEVV